LHNSQCISLYPKSMDVTIDCLYCDEPSAHVVPTKVNVRVSSPRQMTPTKRRTPSPKRGEPSPKRRRVSDRELSQREARRIGSTSTVPSSCSKPVVEEHVKRRRVRNKLNQRRYRRVKSMLRIAEELKEDGAELFFVILPQRGVEPRGCISKGFSSPFVDEEDVYHCMQFLETDPTARKDASVRRRRREKLIKHRTERKHKYQKKIRRKIQTAGDGDGGE